MNPEIRLVCFDPADILIRVGIPKGYNLSVSWGLRNGGIGNGYSQRRVSERGSVARASGPEVARCYTYRGLKLGRL